MEMIRKASRYLDPVLKGANPGDLPVQQPTRFELFVNLKTAKTLGLDIPGVISPPRRQGDRIGQFLLQCMSFLLARNGRAALI